MSRTAGRASAGEILRVGGGRIAGKRRVVGEGV